MKAIVIFVSICVAVALGASVVYKKHGLDKDFHDLNSIIPLDDLNKIIDFYYYNDDEVRKIFLYFISKEFGTAFNLAINQPEIKQFENWVADHTQDEEVYDNFDDDISDYENENDNQVFTTNLIAKIVTKKVSGWKKFMTEILAVYPEEEVNNMIADKVAEGGVFAEMWSRLQDLEVVYERILTLPEVVKAFSSLKALGFDAKQADLHLRRMFGWDRINTE